MKTKHLSRLATGLVAIGLNALLVHADVQNAPSKTHHTFGMGLVVDRLPVSMANLTIPLSYYAWERQFVDPMRRVRAGIEIGTYGFYGLLPIPELGTNMYIGGEDQPIVGKIGIGGFYDIIVGGHGGLMIKAGIIAANRFDINLMIVPVGSDSKRSYSEFLGLETKTEAKEYYDRHGYYVKLPYYGLMIGLRI